jgi:hypothetical protein
MKDESIHNVDAASRTYRGDAGCKLKGTHKRKIYLGSESKSRNELWDPLEARDSSDENR